MKRLAGFTLIEALLTIVIISIAVLAVSVPAFVSSKGLGATSESRQAQISALAQKQAEIVSAQLTGLSPTAWVAALSALAGSSPITVTPDTNLDGRTFRITRSYSCLRDDFAADISCSDGFARVKIDVSETGGAAGHALTFIKTRVGL